MKGNGDEVMDTCGWVHDGISPFLRVSGRRKAKLSFAGINTVI